ncbi:MAG: hypothetical protein KF831_16865 [Acidobacteria bacterium]|nr:hypothetical protein [Acidobacteriota bacterium]
MTVAEEKERGNVYYDVQYRDQSKVVSISYENIEDYLQIIVFRLENGELPDYDDKTKTLHLSQLNRITLPNVDKNEIISNSEYFSKYVANGEVERQLLKSAKELRLCLMHFDVLNT